jgi:hypothetical protein
MSASHRHTIETIPWLVNGRVTDDERRELDEHLRACAECRTELALQQRVRTAVANDNARIDYAPGASLQKLWTRIGNPEQPEQIERPVEKLPVARSRAMPNMMKWLVAAVFVEAIGIALLATAFVRNDTPSSAVNAAPPTYRTVTTTELVPASAALRVVFAPNFSIGDINALLRDQHLEIVNGPTTAGVYTLATVASPAEVHGNLPNVLANLRANPGVRFAEPIGHTTEIKP